MPRRSARSTPGPRVRRSDRAHPAAPHRERSGAASACRPEQWTSGASANWTPVALNRAPRALLRERSVAARQMFPDLLLECVELRVGGERIALGDFAGCRGVGEPRTGVGPAGGGNQRAFRIIAFRAAAPIAIPRARE